MHKYLVMGNSSRTRNLHTTNYSCVKRASQLLMHLTDPLVAFQYSVARFLTRCFSCPPYGY